MALVEWNEGQFTVSVEDMDLHHKKLVRIMNLIHECKLTNASFEQINPLVKELLDYTKFHFAAEERYMLRLEYPGYEQQQKQHSAFVAKLIEFGINYEAGKTQLTEELLVYFRD